MAPLFLIGGGREDDQVRASHSPFVAACAGGPVVAYALEDPERWEGALRLAGATEVRCLLEPPSADDLEELGVRDGLGMVDFAVDVHATQWGTLTRLVHAVGAGLVDEGWAIDEGTALVVDGGSVRVEGLGSAYRVAARDGEVAVSVQP